MNRLVRSRSMIRTAVGSLARRTGPPLGLGHQERVTRVFARTATTSDTGAFLPNPEQMKLGISGITVTVTLGLLLGATISKNIAAFLEENELFVPSDDDDDD